MSKVVCFTFLFCLQAYVSTFIVWYFMFCTLSLCSQLSAWMEMVARFEVDQQLWRRIPILIHQLPVIHATYGKWSIGVILLTKFSRRYMIYENLSQVPCFLCGVWSWKHIWEYMVMPQVSYIRDGYFVHRYCTFSFFAKFFFVQLFLC